MTDRFIAERQRSNSAIKAGGQTGRSRAQANCGSVIQFMQTSAGFGRAICLGS
jgi:hypothetical protein